MHPLLTQVPPKRLRSMIATFIPAPASRTASGGPACPVPMMIASYVIVITIPQSVQLAYSVWFSHISNSNIQAPSYEAESSLA